MPYKKFWSIERVRILTELLNSGKTINEIAKYFDRSTRSIRSKLANLGISLPIEQDDEKEVLLCLNCDEKIISSVHKTKKFCSQKCSAIYNNRKRNYKHSEDTKKKISKSITEWHRNNEDNISNVNWKNGVKAIVKKSVERLMNEPFEELSWDRKRKRILIEQKNICDECGIKEWQDKPLSLEIDHVDGDKKNNKRENLRGLCPNCHSQTDTFRGKNKSSRKYVSDEKLLKSLNNSKSIRQALLNVGMAGKGANYKRVKNLMLEKEIKDI